MTVFSFTLFPNNNESTNRVMQGATRQHYLCRISSSVSSLSGHCCCSLCHCTSQVYHPILDKSERAINRSTVIHPLQWWEQYLAHMSGHSKKYPVALLQIRLMMHFCTGTIELLMGEDPLLRYPCDSFMKVCNDGGLSGMMDDVKPWLRCLTSHLSQEQLSCLSPKEGDSFASWHCGDWTWTLPEPQNKLWKDEPAYTNAALAIRAAFAIRAASML